ncbi:ABC transporter substrate-binding protein [Sinorhizobium meliloti]|uniref:ABC transporter substrate-binding protein n=1 Tax=Rhizobium meliloti TaxID=382 RepID=UPI0012971526|nr:ABC transporter substrate-binding protein [Sinorhizobium meliloti]MQU68393.1 glycine/betaine ABC transporter substrate-binding protein [Sinorhizobium meliloti]
MKVATLKIAAVLLAAAFTSSPAFAECGKVTITEMNWASAAVVTAISKFVMEQGYGCSVTVVPSASTTAVTSVAETGQPDIVTELWLNGVPAYPKLVEEGKVRTLAHVLSDGGIDAWWVPKYLVDQHPELASIEGILANPKLVGGRFHNCPDGWGCKTTNGHLAQAYDFSGHGIEVFNHGSGETLAASIAAAYENQEPWFGYYWAPTSVLGRYPMVQVKVADYDPKIHACNAAEECATPGKSAYPAAEVVTAVTTDFETRQPEIAALMSKVSFTNAQMSDVLAWQETKKASSDEAAVYFLTKYKDVWAGWLSADAKLKLSALLK